MRFRLSMTLKRSKKTELHVVTEFELFAHAFLPPYYNSNKLQESVRIYSKKAQRTMRRTQRGLSPLNHKFKINVMVI